MFSRTSLFFSIANHYERLGLKLAMPKGLEAAVSTTTTSSGATSAATAVEVYRYCDFTEAQIKAAYRRKALECHPDVAASHERVAAEAEFRKISEAFTAITDPSKRRAIDEELQQTFDEKIVRQHGGRIVYKKNTVAPASSGKGAAKDGTAATYTAVHTQEAALREAFARKRAHIRQQVSNSDGPFAKAAEGAQTAAAANARRKEASQSLKWVDNEQNLHSTLPVGRGVPSYENYLREAELEEEDMGSDDISSHRSFWVKSSSSGAGNKKSASSSSSSRASSASSTAAKRAPFLRKDADSAFKKAFDGKSWNEVLFQMRYENRYQKQSDASSNGSNSKNAPASEEAAKTNNGPDATADSSSSKKNPAAAYKLRSPLLRNAAPLTSDQTIASIFQKRYANYAAANSNNNGGQFSNGGVASTISTTADDGPNMRRAVSGASAIPHSPLYHKMATYADGLYARQQHYDAVGGGEGEEDAKPLSVAEGGPVAFPSVAPSPPEGIPLDTDDLAKGTIKRIRAHRVARDFQTADADTSSTKKYYQRIQARLRSITERDRIFRQRAEYANLPANSGQLYSYQRPY